MKNGVRTMRRIKWYPFVLKTKDGDKWGYMDEKGRYVIRPVFQDARDFQENGLAIVKKGNYYGIINEEFDYVVTPKYDLIYPFSEGRTQVVDEKGYRVIDEQGKVLTKKSYSFIGKYSESRAVVANSMEDGSYLYGYLDEKGKEIIPLQYEVAQDFYHGKAVVNIKENENALIDRYGRILQKYPYYTVGALREGKLSFQKKMGDRFGYINEKGEVVIEPQFSTAEPFQDGRAIVSHEKDYWNRYGLIDSNGKVVIPLAYDNAQLLGNKRIALGKAQNKDIPFFTSISGIATTDGKLLTDFNYFGVLQYERGYASAYDNNYTFFLDLNGHVVRHMPIVSGSGTLTFVGHLIKANVDNRLSYYNQNGKLIWRQNTSFPLSKQYRIYEEKFRPNKDYLVYVPQVSGMKNKTIEESVNKRLEILSQVKEVPTDIQLDYSYTGDFSVEFYQKDLLVLQLEGYHYPFGAAHGMPSRIYPHINLVTGKFYTLADLFKKDRDYVKVLSEIIQKQIDSEQTIYAPYIFPDAYHGIRKDQPFFVNEKELAIYFEPYEIAAYAAGFPTFYIPYEEIIDIIDTEGEFWQSFH